MNITSMMIPTQEMNDALDWNEQYLESGKQCEYTQLTADMLLKSNCVELQIVDTVYERGGVPFPNLIFVQHSAALCKLYSSALQLV